MISVMASVCDVYPVSGVTESLPFVTLLQKNDEHEKIFLKK